MNGVDDSLGGMNMPLIGCNDMLIGSVGVSCIAFIHAKSQKRPRCSTRSRSSSRLTIV